MALAGIRLHDITVPNIKWLICFQRHRFEHCRCSVVIETKSSKKLTREQEKLERSGLICVACVLACVHACVVTLTPPFLLSPIISLCTDDSIHICSGFLWGQEVTRASYARMTRQDFFCAPSIPTLLPTDWLTALWLRPSLSQLLLSSLLSSLLVLLMWCEWMLMPEGFSATLLFTHQLKIRPGKEGEKKKRKVEEEGSVRSIGTGPNRKPRREGYIKNECGKKRDWLELTDFCSAVTWI